MENNKPVYVKPALYTLFYENLKEIAKEYGYNLLINGSMNRDLDLVAVAWVDNPKPELELVIAMDLYLRGKSEQTPDSTLERVKDLYLYKEMPGGRHSYVINLNRGDKRGEWRDYDAQYYLDISFTPVIDVSVESVHFHKIKEDLVNLYKDKCREVSLTQNVYKVENYKNFLEVSKVKEREYRDREGILLKKGDLIDIHQTVNGENLFVVLQIEPLDIRYYHNPSHSYEYDKEDLLKIDTLTGEGFSIIGNELI